MRDVMVGVDGLSRCAWCGDTPDYVVYHDSEWGRPVHGDIALFERITLEAFQSGLSWLTILRKRDAFRSAFAGFDAAVVAAFDDADVERLMTDVSIVRNRKKIEATITNARALLAMQAAATQLPPDVGDPEPLDALVWSFAPMPRQSAERPKRLSDLATSTPASAALSKALKAKGFVFVGPTTMHAAMQACGLVDDHLVGCHSAD